MSQFTNNQIIDLKKRLTNTQWSWVLPQLKKEIQVVMENQVLIPHTALATWSLYYFCPEHSVRLMFDYSKSSEHRCPVDGKIFTGDPYDGAWWVAVHGTNARSCYLSGLLWQLTGEPIYHAKAKQILLEYAKYYPSYEVHGNIPHNKPGKAFQLLMFHI